MCVEPEQRNAFEHELHATMRRAAAPPSLKRRVMERRWQQRAERHHRMVWFERVAASLVLVAVVSGAMFWRSAEQKRRGEEAKRQVFAALRITNRALDAMDAQLRAREAQ
jgi:ABC-type transport system involved in cytochrome bd biosynthesis fused ATPase/permease subunit